MDRPEIIRSSHFSLGDSTIEQPVSREKQEERKIVFVVFLYGFTVALFVMAFHIPPPGIAVGLLGFAAGIMGFLGSLGRLAQAAWTAVLFALLLFEIFAVDSDRTKAERDIEIRQANQLARFNAVTSGIKSTNQQSSQILAQTNRVAELAAKSLNNITGGDSFAYVLPSNRVMQSENPFSIRLYNGGQQMLSNIAVRISLVLQECADPLHHCTLRLGDGLLEPTNIGSLAPCDSELLPRLIFAFPRGESESHYWISITAQNGTVKEHLWFKRITPDRMAYRVQVLQSGKRRNARRVLWFDGKPDSVVIETGWVTQSVPVRPKSIPCTPR